MIIGEDGQVASEVNSIELDEDQRTLLHKTIKKVTDDIESLDFNTAISQLMVFVNEFSKFQNRNRQAISNFVKLLSPLAPHIAEELWQRLGFQETLATENWPEYKEEYTKEKSVEILIQIQGKPKSRIFMPNGSPSEEMERICLANNEVKQAIGDRAIKKIVCVPDRLVNIVIG